MRGRLIDMTVGMNGKQRVTIEVDTDFREGYEKLKGADVNLSIKKWRNARSKDANAYAWVLIDRIADALQQDKELVYRQAIREIGGVSDIVCVRDEAVAQLRSGWEHNGTGWSTDVLPSKIAGCTNVVLYYGSSTYDSKQMSNLIEHLVQEAKDLGIETLSERELSLIWR